MGIDVLELVGLITSLVAFNLYVVKSVIPQIPVGVIIRGAMPYVG